MLEGIEGVMTIEVTSGFIGVHWEMGWGVMETMLKLNSA